MILEEFWVMVPFTPPLRGLMHEIFDMIVVRAALQFTDHPHPDFGVLFGIAKLFR